MGIVAVGPDANSGASALQRGQSRGTVSRRLPDAGGAIALAAGLAQAMHSSTRNPKARKNRLRGALVFAEIAIAMTLLGMAGMLARSALGVAGMNRGPDADNVLTAALPGAVAEAR